MSADFQAFSCTTVLEGFPKKVEALEVYDGRVLAGLADGTLCVLEPDRQAVEAPWQVAQALKGFGKRGISQLKVLLLKRHQIQLLLRARS